MLANKVEGLPEELRDLIGKLPSATLDANSSVALSSSTSVLTVANSTAAHEELNRVASSLSAIAQMSHQIAIAAKEQLDAGEDTAKRVVTISDTA